ncbi:geranylgeranyl pyrophosphate synthase-like isoform X2 [Colletes gigas]|uniref:geranylgeranyl pyrophosphate synthase-like isoform X2 n=1 Tax=Colletes gigas TaxID=935657 RepID=UPI001C9B7902|nr:geranylgeranyl pyrophosphate synthase-like isoform X2 [Colletes gigas]
MQRRYGIIEKFIRMSTKAHQYKDSDCNVQLLEPVKYMQKCLETRLEYKIPIAFNVWLKIPVDKFREIALISKTIHVSTIIIDDIQDEAKIRKDVPVAHSIYGIANSLNAASHAMLLAVQKVHALNHPQAMEIFLEEILNIHTGQGLEIYWRDNFTCPSEESYKAMVLGKTTGLLSFMVRSMQLFSNCKEDFTPLINIMGLYIQICNDYTNFHYDSNTNDEGYADDLSTGSFNFPIMHAIQTHPEDTQIKTILKQRTKDITVKRYCAKLLKKFGSFAYTLSVLEDLDMEARREIERLGGNPLFVKSLDKVVAAVL